MMNPRERSKRVQAMIIKATANPFMPAEAKAALAEVGVLLGEWGEILETMKGNPDGEQSNPGHVSVPDLQRR